MAKAINWPEVFRDIIANEDTESIYCAIRPGTLYYDNRYWVDGEIVDIRVNHEPIRKAVIVGDLKACEIQNISTDDLQKISAKLKSPSEIRQYLSQNYKQELSLDSMITIVNYKNIE